MNAGLAGKRSSSSWEAINDSLTRPQVRATREHPLLHRLETDTDIADLLRWPGEFDLDRRDPVEELRLPRGLPLAPIAGCGSGGTYFLCGHPDDEQRPVLYASSEGQVTLIADNLHEAIMLIAAFPFWQDLGQGLPAAALEDQMHEDHPDFGELRDHLITSLRLPRLSVDEAVTRLRAAAGRTAPHYLPTAVGEAKPYELLFS
ncbi:hypothetical protein AB0J63_46425 [Streptosporangium canum]|uniref:hypothetical protein n=1 Tax=Streptosporangium canum TaxID=324952 RepID=UPI00343B8B77